MGRSVFFLTGRAVASALARIEIAHEPAMRTPLLPGVHHGLRRLRPQRRQAPSPVPGRGRQRPLP